jgi:hypothetical protein
MDVLGVKKENNMEKETITFVRKKAMRKLK